MISFCICHTGFYLQHRKTVRFGTRFELFEAQESIKMKVGIFKYQIFYSRYNCKSSKSSEFK